MRLENCLKQLSAGILKINGEMEDVTAERDQPSEHDVVDCDKVRVLFG